MIANPPFAVLNRRHLLVGTAALMLLAGCGGRSGLLGPGPSPQLYMLKPDFAPVEGPTVSWQLDIDTPSAPESLDTSRIVLLNPPARLDYYADAAWPDRLTTLVQSAMVQAFERSGKIAAVAPDSAGLRSDYILQTEIREFNAVYDTPDTAPKVRIHMVVKMIRTRGREIVQTLVVTQEAQTGANTVDAVVVAAGQALGAALKQTVEWALKAPPLPKAVSGS